MSVILETVFSYDWTNQMAVFSISTGNKALPLIVVDLFAAAARAVKHFSCTSIVL